MPRILIADDEKAMLGLYARIFAGRDYQLTMASSYAEAARLIADGRYDLLVTDLTFPDGRGTELVKLFRQKQGGAKSLLVTGTAPVDGRLAESTEALCFEKPFKVDAFLTAVEQALSA
jgi:DNA-binding NtrC family response regulator